MYSGNNENTLRFNGRSYLLARMIKPIMANTATDNKKMIVTKISFDLLSNFVLFFKRLDTAILLIVTSLFN